LGIALRLHLGVLRYRMLYVFASAQVILFFVAWLLCVALSLFSAKPTGWTECLGNDLLEK